jgi:hypothetical protein
VWSEIYVRNILSIQNGGSSSPCSGTAGEFNDIFVSVSRDCTKNSIVCFNEDIFTDKTHFVVRWLFKS